MLSGQARRSFLNYRSVDFEKPRASSDDANSCKAGRETARMVGGGGEMFAAGQRLVERRHRRRLIGRFILRPDVEDAQPGQHKALKSESAERALGVDAGGLQHEAHGVDGELIERRRGGQVAPRPSADFGDRGAVGAIASRRRINTSNSRSLSDSSARSSLVPSSAILSMRREKAPNGALGRGSCREIAPARGRRGQRRPTA